MAYGAIGLIVFLVLLKKSGKKGDSNIIVIGAMMWAGIVLMGALISNVVFEKTAQKTTEIKALYEDQNGSLYMIDKANDEQITFITDGPTGKVTEIIKLDAVSYEKTDSAPYIEVKTWTNHKFWGLFTFQPNKTEGIIFGKETKQAE